MNKMLIRIQMRLLVLFARIFLWASNPVTKAREAEMNANAAKVQARAAIGEIVDHLTRQPGFDEYARQMQSIKSLYDGSCWGLANREDVRANGYEVQTTEIGIEIAFIGETCVYLGDFAIEGIQLCPYERAAPPDGKRHFKDGRPSLDLRQRKEDAENNHVEPR